MSTNNSHFTFLPNISYLGKNSKNIILRTKIREDILNRTTIFYDYHVKNTDKPELIAKKYYGDATLDWLIYFVNGIIDPYYQWVLDTSDFESFIAKKYGSIQEAMQKLYQYEKIMQHKTVLYDDTIVQEKYLVVDYDNFIKTPISDRRQISCFDYEQRLNEQRRKIKLLDQTYLNKVLTEIREIYGSDV